MQVRPAFRSTSALFLLIGPLLAAVPARAAEPAAVTMPSLTASWPATSPRSRRTRSRASCPTRTSDRPPSSDWHPQERQMLIRTRFARELAAPRGGHADGRPHPAHVLQGPGRAVRVPPERPQPGRLQPQRGRRRELPALPARPPDRQGPALHRRQEPAHFGGVVAATANSSPTSATPATAATSTSTSPIPRAGQRAASGRAPGLLGRARLEPGRQPHPARRDHLGQRELPARADVATGKIHTLTPRRPSEAKDRAETVAYQGGDVVRGRPLDHHHQRRGTASSSGWCGIDVASGKSTPAAHRPALGRGALRPLGRRQAARLRPQRGRLQPSCTSSISPTGKELPAPELPRRTGAGLRFRPGSHEVAFALSWARSPSDVYSYDPDRKRLERWTASEVGGLNAARFADSRAGPLPLSFDGREDPGLRLPAGRRTASRARARSTSTSMAAPRASRGPTSWAATTTSSTSWAIAYIVPNVRGSSGYGKTYLQAGQRRAARGLGQGHRRPARLDRHPARPRRLARDGDRRLLRRLHGARLARPLQRPAAAAPASRSASATS